jgi:bifunctional non-homologous end joining protein LigD
MDLKEYRRKRKFDRTPEPPPRKPRSAKGPLRFVVQKHDASRTHYDFRLELDGTLKSWAVPKGPTLTSNDPRLAVEVEDHPIAYGSFEGVIPKGNYGAGTVMVWDAGTYVERTSQGRQDSEIALRKGLTQGHITFILHGEKLRGEFALIKIKNKQTKDNAWLLIKKHDAEATRRDVLRQERSTQSGRSMKEIAREAIGKGEVWIPGKGRAKKSALVPQKLTSPPPPPKHSRRGGKIEALPRRIRVMEPVFATAAPEGRDWKFEVFGAGTRALAEVEPTRVQIYSRSRLPLDAKYPAIVKALRKLGKCALLDGEIVRQGSEFTFAISDLLYLDGKDLRELPQKKRRAFLEKLKLKPPLALNPERSLAAELVLPSPSAMIVAKRVGAPYRSGLSRDWLRFRPRNSAPSDKLPSDKPPLTHLDKVFWPREKITKGDLLRYYESVAKVLLPHLADRPQSLHRQPNGIGQEGFFHKDMTSYLPRRIQTVRVQSASSNRTINYALCQDLWSLLYLINLGCIELNPWLSRKTNLEKPDLIVIDLDPDENEFRSVVKVALEVRRILKSVGAESYCKTSGATGLHICIPTGGRYDYDTGRAFAEAVCKVVLAKFPKLTSMERNPAKRRGRIYLDYLQNRRGQTLAAPYCVRPRPGAPVSTPLKWSELKPGLRPESFTIRTTAKRIAAKGDLWAPLLNSAVDIVKCMKRLSRLYHL